MKTRSFIIVTLVATFLTSCVSGTSTLATTVPLTVAPHSTAIQSSKVIGRAILSTYPGVSSCTTQVFVPEGTEVSLNGAYGDFASVKYFVDGVEQIGFLPKVNLSEIPSNLEELSTEQVPWKPVVDYRNWSYYSPKNGGELIVSPSSDNGTDIVTDPADHPVPVPLRIHFGLQIASEQWGSVKLYGIPDNHTPWWKDTTRMDVFTNAETYELCIRDGTSEECGADIIVNIPKEEEITFLFLDRTGKHLQVLDNQEKIVKDIDLSTYPGLQLPEGLFPEGVFHFGTSVGYPGRLLVTHLSLTTPPTGNYESNWMTEPGLAELAAPKGILIGTEFNPDLMMDDRYCSIVRHDFNLGAISSFTDARIWLGPDEYDFTILDQQVNDSTKYGLTLYASHLVWGAYEEGVLPDWLKNGDYTKDELLTILHDHVSTLVNRYKDRVRIWSIANEAPERDQYPNADFWYDHIGSEYIAKSFEWAREADPDAILLFNAANNESPRDNETTYNINTLYSMVKSMKEQGVPIDAVGMQTHLFLPWTSSVLPTEADVQATMEKFASLGVTIMITEMDVDLHEINGSLQEKEEIQKQLYRDMMTACIQSGVCTVFSTWGVSDVNSWITADESFLVYQTATPDAAPLLFDVDYNPKPAYFEVRDVLKKIE